MKKVLKIGSLTSLGKKSMILAYRTGQSYQIQGLEFEPASSFTIEKTEHELLIRVRMNDGDFLALDEEPGVADKSTL